MKNNISLVRWPLCEQKEEMRCDRDKDFGKMFSCAVVKLTQLEARSKELIDKSGFVETVSYTPVNNLKNMHFLAHVCTDFLTPL